MKFITTLFAATLLAVTTLGAQAAGRDAYNVVFTVRGDFDAIRDGVLMAVEGKGLNINNRSYISDMLERTGKDIGATRQVYVKAELVEFCSATLSRRMMEADPHNIVMCPYVISIYSLPADPRTIYVAHRKFPTGGTPKSRAAFREVEKLLSEIIQEGIR